MIRAEHWTRPLRQPTTALDDRCDDCGRPMELTGAALCPGCEAADEARRHCTICDRALIFLDQPECSDECEEEARRLLMSL